MFNPAENYILNLANTVARLERRIQRLEGIEKPTPGTSSWPGFLDSEGDPANVAGAASDGASTYPSRRDHVHTIGGSVVTYAMLGSTAINAFVGTATYTASDVLTKLLTVDGFGSGLDADLLAGSYATDYAKVADANEWPETQYFEGGLSVLSEAFWITHTGTATFQALTVVNDGSGSGFDADLLDGNHATAFAGTAEVTAGTILGKLITVDGTGSGLDADLLDGNHASAFSGTAHTHSTYLPLSGGTVTGTLGMLGTVYTAGTIIPYVGESISLRDTGGVPVLTVPGGGGTVAIAGRLGVGTATPDVSLSVVGNAYVSDLFLSQRQRAVATTALADDATSTLTTAGVGLIYCVNTTDAHHFLGYFSVGGVIEVSDPSATWAQADTDGSNCLYWSSGLVLKNRRGSSKNYIFHIWGSTAITT